MSIQDFLDQFEDEARPYAPFNIMWTEKGRGFGQYYFYIDEDDKVHIDNECDTKESIKRILCRMVDDAVLDNVPFVKQKALIEQEQQDELQDNQI